MEMYFDRNGVPIDRYEWSRRFNDHDYQRVSFDEIGDVKVSTVWLGLNHAYGSATKQIFETMIFGGDHDNWCQRYATIAQAIAGHRAVVEALKAGAALPE